MNERGLTKNQIITELTKSPHGKLEQYRPVCQKAAVEEPEFLAHLIAWDRLKGQIRDSKVALPVLSLVPGLDNEFADNSLAHLSLLNPREYLRAYRFAREMQVHGRNRIRNLTARYLTNLEANWGRWQRTAVQHKGTLKELYALGHIKPSEQASAILFRGEYPSGSIFETISLLKAMTPVEAAGTIMEWKIPFQIALGALGAKAKEPDLVMALINSMTPTQLVTNTKMLERLGIKTVPALKAAFEVALVKAAGSKKAAATLKTTEAAEAIEDEGLKAKLQALQEKQIEKIATVDGNWLVLGDKSGSMSQAIEASKQIAATLARMVKGSVYLVFFDNAPRWIDVTGKSLEEITKETRHVTANGGTNMGCGLLAAIEKKVEVNGIAVISDGGENQAPAFAAVYNSAFSDVRPPVYFYRLAGDPDVFTGNTVKGSIDVQTFDLRGGVDYYALPNLVQTMRVSRYSLIDEIMATGLLKVEDILKHEATKSAKGKKRVKATEAV